MAYECMDCENDEAFERILTIKEPFEEQPDGTWEGDHAREEVLEVHDVRCVECGGYGLPQVSSN